MKFFRDFYDYYRVKNPVRHGSFFATARTMLPEDDLLDMLGATFVSMHERAAQGAGKSRWADKVPENLVFLDGWQRLLGNQWILLHVVRNPLDTLASVREVEFPMILPGDLEDLIELYAGYHRAGIEFGERNPDRYVRICYEDLIAEPERSVRTLMSSLNEQFHASQLEINRAPHQRGIEDPKAPHATEIYDSGIGRWERDLTAEEISVIVDGAAEIWSQLSPPGRHPLPSVSGSPS